MVMAASVQRGSSRMARDTSGCRWTVIWAASRAEWAVAVMVVAASVQWGWSRMAGDRCGCRWAVMWGAGRGGRAVAVMVVVCVALGPGGLFWVRPVRGWARTGRPGFRGGGGGVRRAGCVHG